MTPAPSLSKSSHSWRFTSYFLLSILCLSPCSWSTSSHLAPKVQTFQLLMPHGSLDLKGHDSGTTEFATLEAAYHSQMKLRGGANEDNAFCLVKDGIIFTGVFDGIGGSLEGGRASRIFKEALLDYFRSIPIEGKDPKDYLREAMRYAGNALSEWNSLLGLIHFQLKTGANDHEIHERILKALDDAHTPLSQYTLDTQDPNDSLLTLIEKVRQDLEEQIAHYLNELVRKTHIAFEPPEAEMTAWIRKYRYNPTLSPFSFSEFPRTSLLSQEESEQAQKRLNITFQAAKNNAEKIAQTVEILKDEWHHLANKKRSKKIPKTVGEVFHLLNIIESSLRPQKIPPSLFQNESWQEWREKQRRIIEETQEMFYSCGGALEFLKTTPLPAGFSQDAIQRILNQAASKMAGIRKTLDLFHSILSGQADSLITQKILHNPILNLKEALSQTTAAVSLVIPQENNKVRVVSATLGDSPTLVCVEDRKGLIKVFRFSLQYPEEGLTEIHSLPHLEKLYNDPKGDGKPSKEKILDELVVEPKAGDPHYDLYHNNNIVSRVAPVHVQETLIMDHTFDKVVSVTLVKMSDGISNNYHPLILLKKLLARLLKSKKFNFFSLPSLLVEDVVDRCRNPQPNFHSVDDDKTVAAAQVRFLHSPPGWFETFRQRFSRSA